MKLATHKTIVALLHTLLFTIGCSDSVRCGDTVDARDTVQFRLATFNAGLAPLDVEYAAERAPLVVESLAEKSVDLLCVQEFWLQEDWNSLVEATATTWPNTERLPAQPVEVLCSEEELDPLQTCVEAACTDSAGAELATCALTNCAVEVSALSPGCTGCMIGQIGLGADMAVLLEACVGDSDDVDTFIFEGEYDTGILTSAEVLEQESLVLDSYLLRAAVNYVRINTPVGELDVFCTHLASEIPQFEYLGDFGTWKGEQARQIEQLLEFIEQKNDGTRAVAVLGDLNNGPGIEVGDIVPEWEDHYQLLIDQGFGNPYAQQSDVACTDCPESTFHSADSDAKLIDHILLRGFEGSAQAERFMTDLVNIKVDEQDVQTNLSDHFGLVLTLEVEIPRTNRQ